jgi:hypothetical protein
MKIAQNRFEVVHKFVLGPFIYDQVVDKSSAASIEHPTLLEKHGLFS